MKMILLTFGAIAVVILLTFFYSIYHGRDLDRNPILKIRFFDSHFFFIAIFFILALLLGYVFYYILFFIPGNWGFVDQDNDWVSIRGFVAFIAAFIICAMSTKKIGRFYKTRIYKKESERLGY